MMSKVTIEPVTKALECQDADVAKEGFLKAPKGSREECEWKARWIVLDDARADAEISQCTDAGIARNMCLKASGITHAKDKWEALWVKLSHA